MFSKLSIICPEPLDKSKMMSFVVEKSLGYSLNIEQKLVKSYHFPNRYQNMGQKFFRVLMCTYHTV